MLYDIDDRIVRACERVAPWFQEACTVGALLAFGATVYVWADVLGRIIAPNYVFNTTATSASVCRVTGR